MRKALLGKFYNTYIYVFLDSIALCCAYALTLHVRFNSGIGLKLYELVSSGLGGHFTDAVASQYLYFYSTGSIRIVLQLLILIFIFSSLLDVYTNYMPVRFSMDNLGVILANFCTLGVVYAYFYINKNTYHPRSVFVSIIAINIVISICLRMIYLKFRYALCQKQEKLRLPVLIIGKGEHAESINADITNRAPSSLYVHEFVSEYDDVMEVVKRYQSKFEDNSIAGVILADETIDVKHIMMVMDYVKEYKLFVKVLSKQLSVIVVKAKIRTDVIGGIPLIHFNPEYRRLVYRWIVRVASVCAAFVGIIVSFPITCLLALAIKMTSKGRVLFVQERMGVNKEPFMMYKFRTMYEDADQRLAELEALNESSGTLFKMKNDPRIIPVGNFLRRYSLDELPQFINILKGDMVLVGPRPLPRRDFNNYYEDWHYGRHDGLPGLTCLWQVSGRSDLDFQEMCMLDIYYIRNFNWVLDVKICFRTIGSVLFASGAY
ncbi:MAG: exopolysaccharide biosynthesis polyprenyl glycosylphosphotransferase [Kiritimatiellae bacterium]|jgi:exopolysaccharide biosynthesis polyprenyl glycosylphosphotransferase|nr:exopolysaccharide biosynthesis polyprenyl glycosylphosphotransferase [Kiritimatiellia bacterium]